MLSFNPTRIRSRDIVDSRLKNKNNERLDADLKEMFSMANIAAGRSEQLFTMFNMLDRSVIQYQRELLENFQKHKLYIDGHYENTIMPLKEEKTDAEPSDRPLKEEHKANTDLDTGCITLNQINEDNNHLIIEYNSNTERYLVKEDVLIRRQANAFSGTNPRIYESDNGVESMFLRDTLPYIVDAVDVDRAELLLTISKYVEGFNANTLKIIPFPSVRCTYLDDIKFMDNNDLETGQFQWYDNETWTLRNISTNHPELNYSNTSVSQLITFKPRHFNKFSLKFYSPLNVGNGGENRYSVGVQYIDLMNATYSSKSYVGFIIDTSKCSYINDIKFYNTRLRGDEIKDGYIKFRIYHNRNDFDEITTDFDVSNIDDLPLNVSAYDEIYLLVEIVGSYSGAERINTSPVISHIDVFGSPSTGDEDCFNRD